MTSGTPDADRVVAYFSMEVMLCEETPTYAGGLGALAGDTILSAADARVPLVAVTLLYRKGYIRQRLDAQGRYGEPDRYAEVMKHAIAFNGSYFNSQRMLQPCVVKAYST